MGDGSWSARVLGIMVQEKFGRCGEKILLGLLDFEAECFGSGYICPLVHSSLLKLLPRQINRNKI